VEKFVQAVGVIDGVNRDFSTQTPYVSLTLRVLRNGLVVKRELEDGFLEISSSEFQMKRAPVLGDTLFTFYEEA